MCQGGVCLIWGTMFILGGEGAPCPVHTFVPLDAFYFSCTSQEQWEVLQPRFPSSRVSTMWSGPRWRGLCTGARREGLARAHQPHFSLVRQASAAASHSWWPGSLLALCTSTSPPLSHSHVVFLITDHWTTSHLDTVVVSALNNDIVYESITQVSLTNVCPAGSSNNEFGIIRNFLWNQRKCKS